MAGLGPPSLMFPAWVLIQNATRQSRVAVHPRLGPASKTWMPGTKPGHDVERVTGHREVSLEAAAIIGRAEERSPNRESPGSSWPGFVPQAGCFRLGS